MWFKILLIGLLILGLFILIAILFGSVAWHSEIEKLQSEMETQKSIYQVKLYHADDIINLPIPVQRFFRAVLKEGQSYISAVYMEQTGFFNMSESGEQWKFFRSTQHVITQSPGFIWDARIRMVPGMHVHVLDAYVSGKGLLRAKLLGFLTVMDQPVSRELTEGELMRYLAESAWYPTVLLPGQGVEWEPIDDTQARAILTDGKISVQLIFRFDENGLIGSVYSEGRYRESNGNWISTPWEGRFWNYQWINNVRVPMEGEVSWVSDTGLKPYWKGRIRTIRYEYGK